MAVHLRFRERGFKVVKMAQIAPMGPMGTVLRAITIPRVPKKRNGGFSVHCELKVVNIFTSPYKVSSAEENDT